MENKFGVFVGRFCPVHLGHEVVIEQMIKGCGPKNCLLIIGSSNNPMSLRNLFSYEERRAFLKTVFPDLQIIGLPDYSNNKEWLLALDDILALKGINPQEVIFFGGCEEDIHFFFESNRQCQLLNRFDGSTPKISATEVRDALIQGRPLGELLSLSVIEDVKTTFEIKWERFRKM
jgi:cytidyltransferase-like protein